MYLHSLHSEVREICAKKDNDHQIQSAGDHCRSLPHDRPGATDHRRGAQIHRRLHGMGMDRQLSTIPTLFTIAGGISEGIFTADSRELNIHPITPAQAG